MPFFPEKTRILVPVELPEPEDVPERMRELLGGTRVLLVGWYQVPEQTPPEQARAEVDDAGEEALDAVARKLGEAGAEVEVRLVFTPDLVATIQRLGVEEAVDAALIQGALVRLERLLVVLREDVRPETVSSLLSDLSGGSRVTLLHISEDEADEGWDWSEGVLERLGEAGVDTHSVEIRVETADDPGERVLAICRDEDFDVVVVPERGRVEDRLFGSFAERVGREAGIPVLVIRGGE